MRISFSPSVVYGPEGREHGTGDALADISRADLRWYYFLGSLHMIHEEVEMGPSWSWIPLFDSMYSIQRIMSYAGGADVLPRITFTENDEAIDFSLKGRTLHVTSTYSTAEVDCGASEFVDAGRQYIGNELRSVVERYPSLLRNQHVITLADTVGLDLRRVSG